MAKEKALDVTQGVYVDSVTVNSAAGDAGIKEGDVILEIENTPVETSAQLMEIIGRHRPGDKLELKIDREGKKREYHVTLRNKDGEEEMVERQAKDILDVLGIELEQIDNKIEQCKEETKKWVSIPIENGDSEEENGKK